MDSTPGAPRDRESWVEGLPGAGEIIAQKYRVESVLGRGGMGAVVAATHLELGQRVAIKFLLPEAAARPEPVARFLREARSAAGIVSDHVARVLDVGNLGAQGPYMVMEHLAGADLGRVLRERGPLPIAVAADYLLQACEAIAAAHALGIVHRDLKPSNLFLVKRPDGSEIVKVLDFGIAKAISADVLGPDPAVTATGAAMGSPRYMSPELVRNAKSADVRSDVWALGVILHELVTGTAPFDADAVPAVCAKIIADEPPLLRSLLPDAPRELEELVSSCLEKDIARRLPDVGAFARALGPFAPEPARASVERVTRVLAASALCDTLPVEGSASKPARPSRSGAEGRSGITETASAWDAKRPDDPRPRRAARALGALAIGALAIAGIAAIAGRRAPDPSTAREGTAVASTEAPPSPPEHVEAAAPSIVPADDAAAVPDPVATGKDRPAPPRASASEARPASPAPSAAAGSGKGGRSVDPLGDRK